MVDGPAAEDGKGGRNEPTDARGDEAKTSLPFRIVAAYSFGQLGWAVLINIISFWLVFLYSGEFRPDASAALVAGIGLSVIAGGGRVFDAVIDPLTRHCLRDPSRECVRVDLVVDEFKNSN